MKSITKRWPWSYLVVGVIPQRLSNQARDIVTEGREKLEEEFWSNELSFDSLVRLRISSSTSRKQMRIFSSQIQVNYGWNYFALIRTNNKLYFGGQSQNCPGTENLNRNKYSISLLPWAKSRPKSLGIKRWKVKRVVGQAPPGKDHPHPPPPLPRPEGWSPFSLSLPGLPSSSSPLL